MTSYHSHNDPTLDAPDLAATETLFREHFEAAVGQIPIDSASLLSHGLAGGRRLARRRRVQRIGAGVAAVAVIAAAGVATLQSGLLDSNGAGPAHEIEQLVPSNPRALAAAVIAHLPSDARLISNGGIASPRPPGIIEADLTVSGEGGDLQLNTIAGPRHLVGHLSCRIESLASCRVTTLPDGDSMMTGRDRQRSWLVIVLRDNDVVVLQERVPTGAIPSRPPVALSVLEDIGTDPVVGLQTSSAMVQAGRELSDFTRAGRLAGASGSASASSGSGTAQRVKAPTQPDRPRHLPRPLKIAPSKTVSPPAH